MLTNAMHVQNPLILHIVSAQQLNYNQSTCSTFKFTSPMKKKEYPQNNERHFKATAFLLHLQFSYLPWFTFP